MWSMLLKINLEYENKKLALKKTQTTKSYSQ